MTQKEYDAAWKASRRALIASLKLKVEAKVQLPVTLARNKPQGDWGRYWFNSRKATYVALVSIHTGKLKSIKIDA